MSTCTSCSRYWKSSSSLQRREAGWGPELRGLGEGLRLARGQGWDGRPASPEQALRKGPHPVPRPQAVGAKLPSEDEESRGTHVSFRRDLMAKEPTWRSGKLKSSNSRALRTGSSGQEQRR